MAKELLLLKTREMYLLYPSIENQSIFANKLQSPNKNFLVEFHIDNCVALFSKYAIFLISFLLKIIYICLDFEILTLYFTIVTRIIIKKEK